MRRGLKLAAAALLLTILVELAVFLLVGQRIGFGWALLAVAATSLLGMFLLRREGMRAWRGFHDQIAAGAPPGPQVTNGVVGLAAGLLLAVPGLVTAAAGLLLTTPPARRIARRWVQHAAERRIPASVAGDLFGPRTVRVYQGQPQPTAPKPSPEAGPTIEGEVLPRQR